MSGEKHVFHARTFAQLLSTASTHAAASWDVSQLHRATKWAELAQTSYCASDASAQTKRDMCAAADTQLQQPKQPQALLHAAGPTSTATAAAPSQPRLATSGPAALSSALASFSASHILSTARQRLLSVLIQNVHISQPVYLEVLRLYLALEDESPATTTTITIPAKSKSGAPMLIQDLTALARAAAAARAASDARRYFEGDWTGMEDGADADQSDADDPQMALLLSLLTSSSQGGGASSQQSSQSSQSSGARREALLRLPHKLVLELCSRDYEFFQIYLSTLIQALLQVAAPVSSDSFAFAIAGRKPEGPLLAMLRARFTGLLAASEPIPRYVCTALHDLSESLATSPSAGSLDAFIQSVLPK
ncbi:hypothetical protein CAOG_01572 [Capsaspora owczarzaki ATCC 30864]|uniref:hypothetical protein n=1 Tax=Capsaspora owczarzaki (strain ATCC 30864) TaxID=595528 RepID=UPI0001FE58BD|nr:hypothetical protein CAOG_01572 [Capsaspora owczarzaki ATCC 30864]|eukprot:XP_004364440.1 hypothetical protein CAOG_01572 [Capsaspora owczarzaki ATCC 30864]